MSFTNTTLTQPSTVGLPRANPCTSFWLAHDRSSTLIGHRTTDTLPANADIVIIGSGMSGAATAWYLLTSPSPPKSVVLLEACEACSGATGRNGGHCRPDSYLGYTDYKRSLGKEQALKIIENEAMTLELVEQMVKDEGIDCDFWRGRGLDVFLAEDVKAEALASLEEYTRDGGKLASVTDWIDDASEAQRMSRIPGAVGGATYPAGSFYPYRFVSHLLKHSVKLGLNLHTTTPVTSVSSSQSSMGHWDVSTPRGTITTPKVVHCTNAWSSHLLPELRGWVTPVKGACSSVTPPLNYSGKHMLDKTMILYWGNNSSASGYLIQRPVDGTIILGSTGPRKIQANGMVDDVDDTTLNPALTERLRGMMREQFKDWSEGVGEGLERVWTGIMGSTRDHIPLVGPVPGKSGQFLSCGHNGHGMARIMTCSRALAERVSLLQLNVKMSRN